MKIQQNIKHNLRLAMSQRNLSLTEFADELGIARSSLQCYLEGTSNPRADTIQLIAQKLDIPLHALIADFSYEHLNLNHNDSILLKELYDILKDVSQSSYKLHLSCEALCELLFNDSISND